jgi:hypothetical protein
MQCAAEQLLVEECAAEQLLVARYPYLLVRHDSCTCTAVLELFQSGGEY